MNKGIGRADGLNLPKSEIGQVEKHKLFYPVRKSEHGDAKTERSRTACRISLIDGLRGGATSFIEAGMDHQISHLANICRFCIDGRF